jgi:hypothetical protein
MTPAATAASRASSRAAGHDRQREAVDQRRPEELPRIGQLDQREKAERLQVDAFGAQPRRQQVEKEVERQAG